VSSGASGDSGKTRLLRGWRRIADHLGRDESTVKRWAAQRGMPIHRLPGDKRSAVYADPGELESWLKGAGGVSQSPAPEIPAIASASPPPQGRSSVFRNAIAAGATIGLVLAVLAGWQLSLTDRGDAVGYVAVPEAQALYLEGTYLWEKRTPESLRQALDSFERAVAIDPNFAPAHAGLANTYNLLREYSLMPAPEAYAKAVEEGRKAIALDPTDTDAMSALAFAEFYGLRLLPQGIARFEEARRLDPSSAKIRHWYANALLHLGRFDDALAEIEVAQELDPGSRSILASKGLALFCAGRLDEARTLLTELAALEPDFLSPRSYLAFLYLAQGDYPAYLTELAAIGALREDPSRAAVADAGRRGLAQSGREGMLAAMLAEEQRQVEAGNTIVFNVARLEALKGDWRAAIHSLKASVASGEEHVMGLNIDPAFRLIRANADFRQFAADLGLPVVR
jgi:tetratricopeptide (TPR) repeat protein